MSIEAIEAVIDLIEIGAVAQGDIVKCLRSALSVEQAQEQQSCDKQEPVAWYFEQWQGQPIDEIDEARFNSIPEAVRFKLYESPPQHALMAEYWKEQYDQLKAQRQPLTDEQIVAINDKHYNLAYRDFDADIAIARAIEAAHGIKE